MWTQADIAVGEQDARSEPAAPGVSAGVARALSPAHLLGLQATAGNRAVTRALAGSRGAPPSGGRRLARFAITLTTKAVTVPNPHVLVDKVQIGDRPPGLFGGQHKSHTVGWETFCDGLRFEVMGQSPDVALQRVEGLYQLLLLLPSMNRVANLPQAAPLRATLPDGSPAESAADRHTEALRRATAAHNTAAPIIATPTAFNDDDKMAALQEFAAAYLQLRNTVPLAAVELPHPSGGAALEAVRAHETGARTVNADELRKALWKLLDVRAVARLGTADTTPRQAPGIDITPDEEADQIAELQGRVADVIKDHLITMKASYPVGFAHTALGSLASVTGFLDTITEDENDIERAEFPTLWIDPIAKAVTTGVLPALAAHTGRAASLVIKDSDKRFSVQLVTARRATGTVVTDMHVGGRPPGPFGTAPGSHVTAWSALIDRVKALVVNASPTAARTQLETFGNTIRSPDPNRVAAMDALAKQSLTAARQAYDNALVLAATTPALMRAQAVARGVLMLLNAQPLSAILSGGLANARSEGEHRDAANAGNTPGRTLAGPARWELLGHLWGLLDTGTLGMLLTPSTELRQLPGARRNESVAKRAVYVIEHHLDIIQAAYPHACTRAKITDLDSLMRLLTLPSVGARKLDAVAIAAELGFDEEAADAEYERAPGARRSSTKRQEKAERESGKTKKKKKSDDDDDDDWL